MNSRLFKIIFLLIGYLAIVSAFFPWYSDRLQAAYRAHAEQQNPDIVQITEQAIVFNPFSIEARLALAEAQHQQGFEQDSKQSLTEATELEPLNFITWEQLAFYEIRYWGQPEAAKIHYQKAIELNPYYKELIEEASSELGIDFAPPT